MADDEVLGRQITMAVNYGGAPWCQFCEIFAEKERGGGQESVNREDITEYRASICQRRLKTYVYVL